MNSMIANMKQVAPNPAFIVVSGDSAAHDMTMADTLASIRYVMSSLQQAFPSVPLYPVVGACALALCARYAIQYQCRKQ